MKRIITLGLLLAAPLLTQAAAPHVMQAAIPANGINNLVITAGVGEVHITPSSDDTVHVRVILEQKSNEFLWFFHWQSYASEQQILAAQIFQQRDGQRLELSLSNMGKMDSNDVKQKWYVQMPVDLALNLNMKVGEVSINGVSGSVRAQLDVGELTMDVPHGSLNARVNVGQISVTTATDQPGNISLSSNIGEAALFMDGKNMSRTTGRHHGLGRSIHWNGHGSDSMHLSVNIGEVDLHVKAVARQSSGKP